MAQDLRDVKKLPYGYGRIPESFKKGQVELFMTVPKQAELEIMIKKVAD